MPPLNWLQHSYRSGTGRIKFYSSYGGNMGLGAYLRGAPVFYRRVADVVDAIGAVNGGTSTNSSNAYTVTLTPGLVTMADGDELRFTANATNSGAATLTVGSIAAKALKLSNGTTALASGDIVSGMTYTVRYDSGNDVYRVISAIKNDTWVPTISQVGTLTISGESILDSGYILADGVCHFWADFTATTGGSAALFVGMTLPLTAQATNLFLCGGLISDGGAVPSDGGATAVLNSTTVAHIYKTSGANVSTGGVRQWRVGGSYPI